jgi:hypothetical protein
MRGKPVSMYIPGLKKKEEEDKKLLDSFAILRDDMIHIRNTPKMVFESTRFEIVNGQRIEYKILEAK